MKTMADDERRKEERRPEGVRRLFFAEWYLTSISSHVDYSSRNGRQRDESECGREITIHSEGGKGFREPGRSH